MPKSVLLVDDEPAILRALNRLLTRAGYRVIMAEGGSAALKLAENSPVSLVITDFRMPHMNGLEFLKQFRLLRPKVPAIILSGFADRESLLECLNSGLAWRFLEKPWEEQQLLRTIEQALAWHQAQQADAVRTHVLMTSTEPLVEVDPQGNIGRFNALAMSALGLRASEIDQQSFMSLIRNSQIPNFESLISHPELQFSAENRQGNGLRISHRLTGNDYTLLRIEALEQAHDGLFHLQGDVLDGTQLRQRLDDTLQQSPNQTLVSVFLSNYAQVAEVLTDEQLQCLSEDVCQRLAQRFPSNSLLACLSRDHYLFSLSQVQHEADLQQQIEQVLHSLYSTFFVAEHKIRLAISVGYAMSPTDADHPRQLIHHAELAARENSQSPAGFYLRFDPAIVEKRRQAFEISNSLYRALEEQQFYLTFQPKITITTQRCDSAEVLLRWHHPTLGQISPALFIPIAEQDGQIQAIGWWVLQQSLQQLVHWREQGYAVRNLAVNVSGRQLQDSQFTERLAELLNRYQLSGDVLELEITETFLMEDLSKSMMLLQRIRQLGCSIAMDDFGTGYSSLAYLTKLPVQILKLDRSIISELHQSTQSLSMVRHMIRMAHELGMEVVAEGIEAEEQLEILTALHCDTAQGFYLSTPLKADEFIRFITVSAPIN